MVSPLKQSVLHEDHAVQTQMQKSMVYHSDVDHEQMSQLTSHLKDQMHSTTE